MGGWVKIGLIQVILAAASAMVVSSSQAQELKLGVIPGLGEVEVRAEAEPLVAYLSNAIGRKVSLYIAKDYADLQTQMEAGAVDIGRFSPFAYVDAARGGKIRVIAGSILDGSATYRGLIITRFDSGVHGLGDLSGKRFAFVNRTSASGYVYPRAMLIEKGVNPERDFKEVIFADSHEKVIAAVLLGPAHAGAICDGAVGVARATGLPTFDLEVIGSTDPIPHDAIAVRVGLEDALLKRIQTALVELGRSPTGRQTIVQSRKKLTGYVPAVDSLFDGVRRIAKIAGVEDLPFVLSR